MLWNRYLFKLFWFIIIMENMGEGKKQIREWTWSLLILFCLGLIVLIVLGYYFGTLNELLTSYLFYVSGIVALLSTIGLFMYKKWGFYLFTIHLIYLLMGYIIPFNLTGLLVTIIFFGYFIWYRAFYKNFSSFE